jgi:hypothetical protein
MNRKFLLLTGGGVLLVASAAHAGFSHPIKTVTISGNAASGILRDVRFSANSVESIGCDLQAGADGNPIWAICMAKNAAGVQRSCQLPEIDARDNAIATALAGLNAASHLAFSWNAAGVCTTVTVSNNSMIIR